jgi:hypothetical protein
MTNDKQYCNGCYSSVNTNRGNSRKKIPFYAVQKEQRHGATGSLLQGNAEENMHPQQWETVFSVGSAQKSYLKGKRRYEFSSKFPVEDRHGRFAVEEE